MKVVISVLLVLLATMPELGYTKSDPPDYYRAINAAEMAIAKRDLPAAYGYYQKAFTINPDKPFSKDLLNAYYCSLDLKHYNKASKYLMLLLARGMDARSIKEFISGQASGVDLDSISRWLTLYSDDTLRTDTLTLELKAMHDKDQATRNYFSKLNDGKYMVDSVFEMDYQNGTRLAQIFARQGVPGEGRTGHLDNNPLAGPVYSIVASHYAGGYAGKKYCHALDTFLFKAIYTYDFDPGAFIRIYNGSEANTTGVPFSYGKDTLHLPLTIGFIGVDGDDKIYPEYLSPTVEARINKEQAILGMPTLNDLRAKVAFRQGARMHKDKYAKYQIVGSITVAMAETYEEAKPYIEKSQKYKPQ